MGGSAFLGSEEDVFRKELNEFGIELLSRIFLQLGQGPIER